MKKRLRHVGHAIITYRTLYIYTTCAQDVFIWEIWPFIFLFCSFICSCYGCCQIQNITIAAAFIWFSFKQFKIDNFLPLSFSFFVFHSYSLNYCHIFPDMQQYQMPKRSHCKQILEKLWLFMSIVYGKHSYIFRRSHLLLLVVVLSMYEYDDDEQYLLCDSK